MYLSCVVDEATRRGYSFDRSKIVAKFKSSKKNIRVKRGQLNYEKEHLLNKLKKRNPALFKEHSVKKAWKTHPCFVQISGGIEDWERNF